VADGKAAQEAANSGGAPAADARQQARLVGVKVDLLMATFDLGIPVDLPELARAVPCSELRSSGGRILVVRSLRTPGWTALVSPTGKVRICTQTVGEVARTAAKRFARLVSKRYSASAAFKSYRVLCVHTEARLGFRVDTESLGRSLPPGCRLADLSPASATVEVESGARKVNVHVYARGRMKVCDGKTYEEGVAAMEQLLPLVRESGTWW